VDRGRTYGFAARASLFVGNVTVKSPLCAVPGNRLIAGVGSRPDGIAIFQRTRRGRDLQTERTDAQNEKKYEIKSHLFPHLPFPRR
jgi:hypothetical protein